MIEYRLFGGWTIFSPIRSKHILFIHQSTAFEIITQIIDTIVIEAVRKKSCIPIDHLHILTKLSQLRYAIVI